MNRTEKDPLQKRLEITNWVLLAVLLAGSLFLRSSHFSFGILAGGLISIANFHGLYSNLLNVFSKQLHRARAAIMIRYYIRFFVTALALYWLIADNRVDVIGLVVGLSVVVLNIVLTVFLVLSKKKCIEEAP